MPIIFVILSGSEVSNKSDRQAGGKITYFYVPKSVISPMFLFLALGVPNQNPMEFTVLNFRKIQMLDAWTQTFATGEEIVTYTPTGAPARILVVTESPALGVHTYHFNVPFGGNVVLSTQQNIVQISVLCVGNQKGDTTTCK